jgi:hypothetical protein
LDLELTVEVPEADLTAVPEVLGALLTEEIEDLVPAAEPDDLVAVDDLVVAPFLDLVMEELLVPALRAAEPIPLLVEVALVAILGL